MITMTKKAIRRTSAPASSGKRRHGVEVLERGVAISGSKALTLPIRLSGGATTKPERPLGFRPLPDLIADAVSDRILRGDYRPGERLNISDIAKGFGVSHVPVREAMRRLEALGLIGYEPNRGAMVRTLSARELREVYAIRTSLEVLAGVEAMRAARPQDIADLTAILRQMDASSDDYVRLHDDFHTAIHRLSGLPLLCEWLAMLRARARPYILLYLHDVEKRKTAQADHYAYVDALRRKDTAGLQRLITLHLARSSQVGSQGFVAEGEHGT
jgi:DNA-binding GntR family transcriptional regulator